MSALVSLWVSELTSAVCIPKRPGWKIWILFLVFLRISIYWSQEKKNSATLGSAESAATVSVCLCAQNVMSICTYHTCCIHTFKRNKTTAQPRKRHLFVSCVQLHLKRLLKCRDVPGFLTLSWEMLPWWSHRHCPPAHSSVAENSKIGRSV